ncbi:hypothetical protein M011DRAFT_434908 [Sporormia fimetaria CBS 119925]|uniref:Uncharacterized protein n=1 Tax=Sporormia fimetaria CBS 119925 TaxID=1340428 RepID=A0A6A6VMP7_9PLEO|nr:hypothetical protein M011DRAFT_434908 [Sporormia fimetaria CBS 119925]
MPGRTPKRPRTPGLPRQGYICIKCRLKTGPVPLRGEQLGPVEKTAHQTFRLRKDTSAKPLPLPPALDPIVQEARSRWTQPKAQPDPHKFTPFQKRLYENAYAHALASPVRQCRATQALLPSSLLLTLHARENPTTNTPWILPVSLTSTSGRLGNGLRFTNRKFIVTELGVRKRWFALADRRFAEKIGHARLAKAVWREDMPEFLLSMLQKRAIEKLTWHIRHSGQLVPCASPRTEDIDGIGDVSCVLYLGSLHTPADDIQAEVQRISIALDNRANAYVEVMKDYIDPHRGKKAAHQPPSWYRGPLVPRLKPRLFIPPLEYKTTVWQGHMVAVFALFDLLGEEKTKELLKGTRFESERCVVMKRARHNVPVESALLQLQAYLAVPGP